MMLVLPPDVHVRMSREVWHAWANATARSPGERLFAPSRLARWIGAITTHVLIRQGSGPSRRLNSP